MKFLVFAGALGALALLLRAAFRIVVVYEYEAGLRYRQGRFAGRVEPGLYWTLPDWVEIRKIDLRESLTPVPGQEILSADGVTVKVSLVASFRVSDPVAATNEVDDFRAALYLEIQLALRGVVGETPIEELLASRQKIGEQLLAATAAKVERFGVELRRVEIRDVMFPGDLKKVFAQVVTARQEAQAALEKARGETASLRSLANAARMLEGNPNLLQLRLLQALGEGSGNTVVFGAGEGGLVPFGPAKRDDP